MSIKSVNNNSKKITVIGGGVIGASWTAVFLSAGMVVTVSDPIPGIEKQVTEYVKNALSQLSELNLNKANITASDLKERLLFEKDTAKAVADADYIQENGPEREDFKVDLWKLIEEHAPSHTIFLSSSSGITVTKQSVKLKNPQRLIIGHPFNPPHLMPLVEVVPGEKPDEGLITKVMYFYTRLGKSPLLVKKELPGFVANRLQSAIFRECVYLIAEGVVKVDELDDIVTSSIGIRWSTSGPFLSFHLGGGQGGMKHFLEHLAPGMESRWKAQVTNNVTFDDKTKKKILEQIEEAYGKQGITRLEHQRDIKEIAVIKALGNVR